MAIRSQIQNLANKSEEPSPNDIQDAKPLSEFPAISTAQAKTSKLFAPLNSM